jgi:hypothetical protein
MLLLEFRRKSALGVLNGELEVTGKSANHLNPINLRAISPILEFPATAARLWVTSRHSDAETSLRAFDVILDHVGSI